LIEESTQLTQAIKQGKTIDQIAKLDQLKNSSIDQTRSYMKVMIQDLETIVL